MTSQTKFQADLTLDSVTRVSKLKKRCYYSITNGWIISQFLSLVHLVLRIQDINTFMEAVMMVIMVC
jgi:hypothetical protein